MWADLTGLLDEDRNWSHVLSLGEQQRLAFSRLLLVRPNFIFLDEATASLDEGSEAALYELLMSDLPNSGVSSVGHRSTLLMWHSQKLAFEGDAKWIKSVLSKKSN